MAIKKTKKKEGQTTTAYRRRSRRQEERKEGQGRETKNKLAAPYHANIQSSKACYNTLLSTKDFFFPSFHAEQ